MVGNRNVNEFFIRPLQEIFERAGLAEDVHSVGVTINFGFIQFGIQWEDGTKDQHLTDVNLNEVHGSIEPVLRKAAEQCGAELIARRREVVRLDTCNCGHRSMAHDVMGTGPCAHGDCFCGKFEAKK